MFPSNTSLKSQDKITLSVWKSLYIKPSTLYPMTYQYCSKEEFEVFSPLYYIMSYEEYAKDMETEEEY